MFQIVEELLASPSVCSQEAGLIADPASTVRSALTQTQLCIGTQTVKYAGMKSIGNNYCSMWQWRQ